MECLIRGQRLPCCLELRAGRTGTVLTHLSHSPAAGPGVAQVPRTPVPIFQSSLGFSELPLPMEATSRLFLLSGKSSPPRRDPPGLGLSRVRVQLAGVLTQHWTALRRTVPVSYLPSVLTHTVELCPPVWDLEDYTLAW